MARRHRSRAEVEALASLVEVQRAGCELAGSPLYARVLAAVAEAVRADGALAELLAPLAETAPGDAAVLRFLAAVHDAVLDGAAPELAARYPSAGGSPDEDLEAVFVATVEELAPRLAEGLDRPVQTNEVGRSAALVGGLLLVGSAGLPVRLLEVGASAGLNLNVERFRYEAGSAAFGPACSPVRFVDPWVGRTPDLSAPLVVESRRGCDPQPIDPGSPAGVRRLRSLVWPDHVERRDRLDAAIAVAARHPVLVDRADAVSWLAHHLAEPVPGTVTVVLHSIVLQYLSRPDRRRFLELLERAGSRASHDAPLAWLRMEPGGDRAEIRLTTWPGAVPRRLGTSRYHGPPVAWTA